jgi:Asp-tRNA(Asn)/Glu-tRNA(Gln) amidotransferase A subunit family amidase
MTTKQGKRRVGSRLIPAVDYLQSQRLRMMMMQELYEATKDVDAYIVASGPSRGAYRTPPKPGGMGGGGGGAGESMSASRRHSSMANLATYPAINLPNGFDSKGSPTNVTVFAQPYKEDIVLGAKKHNTAPSLCVAGSIMIAFHVTSWHSIQRLYFWI